MALLFLNSTVSLILVAGMMGVGGARQIDGSGEGRECCLTLIAPRTDLMVSLFARISCGKMSASIHTSCKSGEHRQLSRPAPSYSHEVQRPGAGSRQRVDRTLFAQSSNRRHIPPDLHPEVEAARRVAALRRGALAQPMRDYSGRTTPQDVFFLAQECRTALYALLEVMRRHHHIHRR
ncbi:hypothetical protein V8F20_012314 [Naviculisporaceae sp. PSN 640]